MFHLDILLLSSISFWSLLFCHCQKIVLEILFFSERNTLFEMLYFRIVYHDCCIICSSFPITLFGPNVHNHTCKAFMWRINLNSLNTRLVPLIICKCFEFGMKLEIILNLNVLTITKTPLLYLRPFIYPSLVLTFQDILVSFYSCVTSS